MFIEKRKLGKSIKYYLVYSYREKDHVKKIRRYLGANLSANELKMARQGAEQELRRELEELSTAIFNFSLTKKQAEMLNRQDKKIEIHHLEKLDWKIFTEQFTYNTNAIEGSTIQPEEVPGILKKKKATDSEEIETKGVANAVAFIRSTKEELSLGLIKKLHTLCFEGSKEFAGEFRKVEVVIKNGRGGIIHTGVPVSQLEKELNEMMDWHQKNKKKFRPLVLAAIMHNQFEHIHPFQDGNGRVGRLLLNFILIKNRYPP
ncbi:MAG: Fic family protein, partial [Candidatus Woesearchaeota archaeon]